MQDRRTHGILTEKPPAQTYCGLVTFGKKTSLDPFGVNCSDCRPVMVKMGILPDASAKLNKPKRGRRRKGE